MGETSDARKKQTDLIREVLEHWPLYRRLTFPGTSEFQIPSKIRLFCTECGGIRNWELPRRKSGSGAGMPFSPPDPLVIGYHELVYTCRDCGRQSVQYFYFVYWEQNSSSTFYKVGQDPPLESNPPAEIGKKLSEIDADLYKKALTSRNFNFGIGALAYLRRIVENRMNDLLDLIEEAAKQQGDVPDELKKVAEVKKSWRFDDKITYAANALPTHLKNKSGQNPLDFLHDLASDGLHHKTEDECIEIFDRCKTAFEYVFRQLRVEIDDAKEYIATLKSKQ